MLYKKEKYRISKNLCLVVFLDEFDKTAQEVCDSLLTIMEG